MLVPRTAARVGCHRRGTQATFPLALIPAALRLVGRGNGGRASPRSAKSPPPPAAKPGQPSRRPDPLVHNAAVAPPAPPRSAAEEDGAAVGDTGAGTQRR
ncbi:hypothetical protein BU14_0524s0005 [Porphyra umbilicalis]|uniref:Uncharacterized protein n=1 Tax=Porphyra umbilicalis TaxID=2786 RepID=A0A1X6NSE6_PORUM|nr:hypothetical protein BU14_0524s0005 [Porphyra umbilicalis]|eukprot:OSX71522.1 hypothetical protein BU14_0524s0005 [Porphyra umbilicalis]